MTSRRKFVKMSYCMVAENTVVTKRDGSNDIITLFMGSLVHVDHKISDELCVVKVVVCGSSYDETVEQYEWICPFDRLLPVTKVLWPLLEAISSPLERVQILQDEIRCRELCSIEVGSVVNVFCVGGNKLHPPESAVVRYKGPVAKKGHGTYFGVELLESKSPDNCNGSFAGQQYFTCKSGCGKFVTVNELRLVNPPRYTPSPPMVSRHSATNTYQSSVSVWLEDKPARPSSTDPLASSKSEGPVPLKPGDHVVWVSDTGQDRGVVRWLHWGDDGQLKVGVYFEELMPGSDDLDKKTVPIPALELVKAEDFYGTNTENKRTKTRTKSESSGGGLKETNVKLRRSDSFRWVNAECDVSARVQDTGEFLHQAPAGNSKIRQGPGDLIKLASSPVNVPEDALLSSSGSEAGSYYDTPEPLPSPDLGVGSLVEVRVDDEPLYGVIRWIGHLPGDKPGRWVAGIEMEEEHPGQSDGTFHGLRYFTCNPQRAFFIGLNQCRKDSRFLDAQHNHIEPKTKEFGGVDCPPIPGTVQPISRGSGDMESLCGKFKGIQGHHNSCYLDATLFSMFAFTSVFDNLLFRPATDRDIAQYEEVQTVLREEIVNPLREKLYVRADRVMKLRTLMEKLSSVTGLTCEEKDPEEFLTSLVAQILKAEPFLKLSSGQEAYHYQLFVEKDEQLTLPTVQQLFEQSFLASDIKLKEVPSCLIIQMPRFGKSFKMYPRILPSQLLDVTDVIEDSPRQCTVCGKLAEYECKECFDQGICEEGLQCIAFCSPCLDTAHSHQKRSKHVWRRLQVPHEFSVLQDHCVIPRLFMELFAVVCIETSHYVAFVKCGTGSDAPWCFFDSMADRKGEQNGYNIPEVVPCMDLPLWLSEKGALTLNKVKDDRLLPEHAKRLLCDAYMCMYQSSEVSMYR
uniref:ubiquitinyl hydrolase 1 n=1 Tax=Homalodisca liturata TaxID=320908 RepID=A0A1B6JGQ8_9HEMI